MGMHRSLAAHYKGFESLPADSALAATVTRIFFGPDWFLTGRAFVSYLAENPVTREAG